MSTRYMGTGPMMRSLRAGPDITTIGFMVLSGWQPIVSRGIVMTPGTGSVGVIGN